MDPLTIAAIASLAGMGLGALKGSEDQKAWKKQTEIEAEKERWSPWTGVHGQSSAQPGMIGPVLQGGLSGAMIGTSLGKLGGSGSGVDGQTVTGDDYAGNDLSDYWRKPVA